jgi:hypothetical protein
MSNLLSGILGALLGAMASVCIAIYTNRVGVKNLELERLRGFVSTAVMLSGHLFDNYVAYNPHLINQNSFGLRVEENYLRRIKETIKLHDEAKYLQHLLPPALRYRWDMMLILISEYSATDNLDSPNRNRARVDVENYISYVRRSCVKYLEGNEIGSDLDRPYLKRNDAFPWTPPEPN